MSMNPQAEDFERLAMRWADSPEAARSYPSMIAAITAFPELYARSRDALPQNDADRAFGLTARACHILDRGVIMAESEQKANKLTADAHALIVEALKLDPACHDAVRVSRYLERPTRDEMSAWLAATADDVRDACLATSRENGIEPPQGRWSLSVYVRPYLRWLFDLANEQLGCGRYRASLATCQRLLELDAVDYVGARQVAAYNYVKLEDAEGLAELRGRYPGDENAWFELSRVFLAYKQRRLDDAAAILHKVVRTYPSSAGCTLTFQDELPPGMFGHLEYADGTDDELYIAVSEAAVILDENCGDYLSALSDWISRDPVVVEARAAEEARFDQMQRRQDPKVRGRVPAPNPATPEGQQPGSTYTSAFAAPASGEAGDESEPFAFDEEALRAAFSDVTCVDDLLRAGSSEEGPQDPETPADSAGRC